MVQHHHLKITKEQNILKASGDSAAPRRVSGAHRKVCWETLRLNFLAWLCYITVLYKFDEANKKSFSLLNNGLLHFDKEQNQL